MSGCHRPKKLKALVKTQPFLLFLYLNVKAKAQLIIYKCSSSVVKLAPGKLKRTVLLFIQRFRIAANVERGIRIFYFLKKTSTWMRKVQNNSGL